MMSEKAKQSYLHGGIYKNYYMIETIENTVRR